MKNLSTVRNADAQSLNDLYELNMHLPYQAACSGKFTVVAFGHLAAALSVIRCALEMFHVKSADTINSLDAALQVLHQVRQRGDQTNIWEVTADELPVILKGINKAEHSIGTLGLALLQQASDLLLLHINEAATV